MIELQTVWSWQPALYLFLGGLGAGTFLVAALIHLVTRRYSKVVTIGMWSAVFLLAVGLLLLISEVSAPFRALLMWQSFSHFSSSWMAIGAWLLFAGIIDFLVAAVAMTPSIYRWAKASEKTMRTISVVCSSLGVVFALGIAIYTGILLRVAPGVPFWNTNFLPALFTVSAIDTGVALVAILFAVFDPKCHSIRYKLELATLVIILVEVAVLVLFVSYMLGGGDRFFDTLEAGYSATAISSALSWLTGPLAVPFWGLFVVVGLVAPFLMALYSLLAPEGRSDRALAVSAGTCVLIGGCVLRFITLLAGAHVDIVLNSMGVLF